jgi:hypothetical protein
VTPTNIERDVQPLSAAESHIELPAPGYPIGVGLGGRTVARIDVENYVSVLEAVCGEFDHLVGHHLTSCAGSPDPWAGL